MDRSESDSRLANVLRIRKEAKESIAAIASETDLVQVRRNAQEIAKADWNDTLTRIEQNAANGVVDVEFDIPSSLPGNAQAEYFQSYLLALQALLPTGFSTNNEYCKHSKGSVKIKW